MVKPPRDDSDDPPRLKTGCEKFQLFQDKSDRSFMRTAIALDATDCTEENSSLQPGAVFSKALPNACENVVLLHNGIQAQEFGIMKNTISTTSVDELLSKPFDFVNCPGVGAITQVQTPQTHCNGGVILT